MRSPVRYGARRTLQEQERCIRVGLLTFLDLPVQGDARIQLAKRLLDPGGPAKGERLTGNHASPDALPGRDQAGGDIAVGDVFAQSRGHLLAQIRGQECGGGRRGVRSWRQA